VLAAQWGARFKEIKGYVVRDRDGGALGRLSGLMLNPEDGSVYVRVARGNRRPRVLPWELLEVHDAARTIVVWCQRELLESAPGIEDPRAPTSAEHRALRRHFELPQEVPRASRMARLLAFLRERAGRAGAALAWLLELPAYGWWRLRRAELAGRLRWRFSYLGRRLDDLRWALWDGLHRRAPRRPPRAALPPPPRPQLRRRERREADV
jgi:hypothetical protein